MLSIIADQIYQVRNAISIGRKRILLGQTDTIIGNEFGVFSAFSISRFSHSKDLMEIPKNFLESFRITNLIMPDTSIILSIKLLTLGYEKPSAIGKKLMFFF